MRDLLGNPVVMKNGTYTCYPGDAMYEDINYDGTIDENDIVYIGNCNPVVTGGAGLTARYKKMSMTMRKSNIIRPLKTWMILIQTDTVRMTIGLSLN
jgi:hypothetical protein